LTLEDETCEHVLPTKTSSQVQVKLLVLTKTLMPFESNSEYDVFEFALYKTLFYTPATEVLSDILGDF